MIRLVLSVTPRWLKEAAKSVVYRGSARYCPICRKGARLFQPFGTKARQDARCPFCHSLERHRLLWLYLQEKTEFFRVSGARMLHVAPERCLEQRFRALIGAGYLTADLMQPADVKMDITNIQYPDNTFDIIYCSHVLEHVPDDRKAMQEMHRVLRPDGWAIILVPITVEKTIEDLSITDPQLRMELYGQSDHVRRYGPDYVDRLREAGFMVTVTRPDDFLSDDVTRRLALHTTATGVIIHCRKNRSA